MPIYVYRCQQCGDVLERRQSFKDPVLTTCETCSGELRRVLQPVGVIFKGSGFYSTDYRHNGAATSSDDGKSDDGKSDDGKSAPSKSEEHRDHKPASSPDHSSSSSESKPSSTPAVTTSSTSSE